MHSAVDALLERSNRLGADRRVTNYGGGNTSAKVTLEDSVTGAPVQVLVVKGSGGDLGTLTEPGLAYLDLGRVLGLEAVHATGVHEDDIVALYARCSFAHGGAIPSIDTPLHAFIDVDHVDHLHPDSIIALAAAADGPALVERCFAGRVGWIDWLRPGFELGLALRAFRRAHPLAVGCVMGGHGIISWADTSLGCEALSLELIATAEAFLAAHGTPAPFGAARVGFGALAGDARAREAAAVLPTLRGLVSGEGSRVAHLCDEADVLEFIASEAAPRLAALGTSCPDHFLRTKVRPLLLDLPATAPLDERLARLRVLHAEYQVDYAAYYDAHALDDSPAMRGADPAIVLLPGVGMVGLAADKATARIATEFYRNAIAVMRGAEAVSSYVPISDVEKFRVEYWELEERKLAMRPAAPPLLGKVALVTGAGSGIGRAIAIGLHAAGCCVVAADLDAERAGKVAAEIGTERVIAVGADVSDEDAVRGAFVAASLAFGGVDIVVNNAGFAASASLLETTVEEWDTLHAVLAKGSFLVSREGARVLIEQGRGGDIVYIVSKNALVAGPSNIAYGAAKADQAHQVRLLAAELGVHGVRVNGINPDGVVRGSGIFSGEWLAQRADAYGVEPEDLGGFYASRTLLGREVLPEHVAEAVHVLVAGGLSRTTGLLIPVDGGLASAFLR